MNSGTLASSSFSRLYEKSKLTNQTHAAIRCVSDRLVRLERKPTSFLGSTIGFAPVGLTMDQTVRLNFVNNEASAGAPLSGSNPTIVNVTQIRGAEGTGSCGEGYDLGVGLVDLDHGLAAGATTYDHGGVLWCETYAPYLWSEQDGTSTLFELEGEFNWEHSTYIPSGMTPDGSTVVGGVIFFDGGTNAPWMWTADGGPVEFLMLPQGYDGGNAVAVSNDGRLIAGNLRGPAA